MVQQTTGRRLPPGTGWLVGMTLGLVVGAVGWWVTREITMLLVLFVATGTALGYTIEQSMNPTPLTPEQRRLLFVLLTLGVVVAGGVALYASLPR